MLEIYIKYEKLQKQKNKIINSKKLFPNKFITSNIVTLNLKSKKKKKF